MDTGTLITMLIGLSAVGGGWAGGWAQGKRNSVTESSTLAQGTISMLTARLTVMESEAAKIPALMERIVTLESLVTQRAEVEQVIEIVTRIEERLDAGS
jgi:hypothetical protein